MDVNVPLAGFEHPPMKDAGTSMETQHLFSVRQHPEFKAAIEAKKVAE